MKTLLICTDFSDAALHAARYGCAMAREYGFNYITFFHAYQSIAPATALPLDTYSNIEVSRAAMEQLNQWKEQLQPLAGPGVTMRVRTEDVSLPDGINEICREESADMIVMGITGKSGVEKVLMGSNAVNVAQKSQYPVLIIPPGADFQPVRTVVLACELKGVAENTPLDALNAIVEQFHAPLHVLNVDHKNEQFSPQSPEEIYQLHRVFDKYKPDYAFIDDKNVTEGILKYAGRLKGSIVVTIPKNYNFFREIVHRSVTSQLIYESDIPLLSLHA